MTSTNWLRNLRNLIRGRRPGDTARKLSRSRVRASLIERFEDRITPAVTAMWDVAQSTLFVDSDGGDVVSIGDDGSGVVTVLDDGSGVTITNGAPNASAVQRIQIVTSAAASTIDLSQIAKTVGKYSGLQEIGVNYDITLDTDIGGGTNSIKTSNEAFSFTLTGAGAGGASASYFISYFDATNFVAGSGNDTFNLNAGGSISGGIDAGGGNDLLSYQSRLSSVTINMNSTGNTGIAGATSGFESARGGAGNDEIFANLPQPATVTFEGKDGNDTYYLNYSQAGDDVVIADDGGASGTGDRLNFSGATYGVKVDLDLLGDQTVGLDDTLNIGGAVIESATGSAFADHFTAEAGVFPSPQRDLNGGLPTGSPGDTLTLTDFANFGGKLSAGQFDSNNGALVNFANFETVSVSVGGDIALVGSANNDSLTLTAGAYTLTLDVGGANTTYTGTLGTVNDLAWDALGGSDTLTVNTALTVTSKSLSDGNFTMTNLEQANLNSAVTAKAIAGDATAAFVASAGQIQDAVDLVGSTGSTITVSAGDYKDDRQININKPNLTLTGPNAAFAGNSLSRGAEAILRPAVSNPDPYNATDSSVVLITASNVTIKGLEINGDDTATNGSEVLTGTTITVDAEAGVRTVGQVDHITIQNSRVLNTSYIGLDLGYYDGAVKAYPNNLVDGNFIQNVGYLNDEGTGIRLYNNFYADVTNNVLRNVRMGIETGNFSTVNSNLLNPPSITGNDIEARRRGIFYNNHYGAASDVPVTNNKITAIPDVFTGVSSLWTGVYIISQQGTVAASFSGNEIYGAASNYATTAGYTVLNTHATTATTITGGLVTGVGYGVWVTNKDPNGFGAVAGADMAVKVSGVSITAGTYGVYVDHDSSVNTKAVAVTVEGDTNITTNAAGTGVFVRGANASALIQNNDNSISGNTYGIEVNAGSATITNNHIFNNSTGVRFTSGGKGRLVGNNFDGGAGNDNVRDVYVDNDAGAVTIPAGSANAFAGDNYYIDNRSTQDFNLVGTGSTFDEASNFRIEDRMFHKQDDLFNSGLTTWVANNRFVTAPGTKSGTSIDTDSIIQSGIGVANANDTVNVEAGTYNQTANVNKTITLLGAAANASIMAPTTGAQQTVLEVSATNVTVDGMAFVVNQDDDAGIGGTAPVAPVAIAAVGMSDFNGLTLKNNKVTSVGNNTVAWTGSPSTVVVYSAGFVLYDKLGVVPSVTIQNNNVDIASGSKFEQRAVWLSQLKANITGNTLKGVSNDLLFAFASGGTSTISTNNFVGLHAAGGAGLQISGPNSNSPVNITNNQFTPTLVPGVVTLGISVNVNANGGTSPITISGNTFTGEVIGVYLGDQSGTVVDGNTFKPSAGLAAQPLLGGDDFIHVAVDSQPFSTTTPGTLNSATIKNNVFNTAAGSEGSAITVANQLPGGVYATVTIGGAGTNNKYQAGFTRGVRQTGGNTAITDTISGATTGVEVAGGTATLVGTNFDGGAGADNATDLRVGSGAGTVTITAGSNNAFAGDGYYIDNQSNQTFNLVPTGSSFDVANNFRIEDRMYHKLDSLTSGLITWVTGNRYVTTPTSQSGTTSDTDSNIQRGVNAALSNDTINVEAGSYGEDVNMWNNPVPLTLLGAGAASTSIVGQLGGANDVVQIGSAQILDGFTITRVLGAGENNVGIVNVGGAVGAIARNNILTGNRTAVYVNGGVGTFTITGNVIDDNRTGILFADSSQGAHTITNNAITNNRTFGVLFLDTITSVNSGLVITGNNITGNFATQLENGSSVVINASGNYWGQASPGNTAPAVLGSKINGTLPAVFAYPGPATPPGSPYPYTITGSSGVDYTPWLTSGVDSNLSLPGFQSDYAVVAVDTVSPQTLGVGRINEGISLAASAGTVNILGGTYTEDVDGALNAVNLAPGASPAQVVVNGNFTLTGDDTLTLELNGLNPATQFDNFVVNGGIDLGGATLVVTGTHVPASGNAFTIFENDGGDSVTGTFNGLPPGTPILLNGQFVKIFYEGNDGNDVVLVYQTPTITYVEDTQWAGFPTGKFIADADSVTAGNQPAYYGYDAFNTIQAAVNAVAASGTVRVNAGSYNEDVLLSKTVAVLGAGPGSSVIVGAKGGQGSSVRIEASNSELAGFTITRDGNSAATWNDPSLNLAGLAIQGQTYTGNLIRDNLFTGNRTAIDINNSNGHTIRNNVIDFNRTGLVFRNQTDNLTVVENAITNNWTIGILFLDASSGSNVPVQRAANSTFFNNNISGNWYAQIQDQQTGGSLPVAGANPKNFSGNWFGTASPVISSVNSTEPGYSSQIPVAYGGSAADPGVAADIVGIASANFDISPWLHFGTDTDAGEYGFQGDFSWLHATAFGTQTQPTGRIQEAVNLITDGALVGASRTVTVLAGTYAENVSIDKALSLQGAQYGVNANTRFAAFTSKKADPSVESIIVPPVSNPEGGNPNANDVVRIVADNVTVDGFTIDGNNSALNGSSTVSLDGVELHGRRGITNIRSDNTVAFIDGVGVSFNIIQNFAEDGITFTNRNQGASGGNTVSNNLLRNAIYTGVFSGGDLYVDVTNNTIDTSANAAIGIWLQNNSAARPGGATTVWSGNTITVGPNGFGAHVNLLFGAATPLLISNNTVRAAATVADGIDGLTWGINVWSVNNASVTISGNTVGDSGGTLARGINVWNASGAFPVSISGGSVGTKTAVGINVDSVDQFFGNSNALTEVNVTGVSIASGSIGVRVRASQLATDPYYYGGYYPAMEKYATASVRVNLTGVTINGSATGVLAYDRDPVNAAVSDAHKASVQFNAGNKIQNATTGVRFDGPDAVIVGATLNNLEFSSVSGDYVQLDSGSMSTAGVPTEIDGTGASFNGVVGGSATLAQGFAIEDKIDHYLDRNIAGSANVGFVRITGGLVYVTDNSDSIQRGVNVSKALETVHVQAGTFQESDISVNKDITIHGAGTGTVVVPAIADAHAGGTFSAGTHNAFVLRSGGITISNLKIDGDGGVGGGGSRNYFGGVVYDYNAAGQPFNNITLSGLTVAHVWRLGIYLDGGINAASSGHLITSNLINDVSGSPAASGILLIQASGNVWGNQVTQIDGDGIATNHVDGPAYAPTVSIYGNTIVSADTGMNLSGLANGSDVDSNVIELDGLGNDVGILVQHVVGLVTVENNSVTATAGDSAIWIYRATLPGSPVVIKNNNLSATGSTSGSNGQGTGIFVTDDGSFFTEATGGASYATIIGNTISGFHRGIDLFRNDDAPVGGSILSVTIGDPGFLNGNSIIGDKSAGSVGIRVFDANGTTSANAIGDINENMFFSSIHGFDIGIDVDGGTATITNNWVYDNNTGVRLTNGGTATINNNKFEGNPNTDNATDIRLDSNAGAITGGTVTGNTFAGTTYYFDNRSSQNITALATVNTYNTANTLETNNFTIENRMYHKIDNKASGLVTWVANNVYVTPATTPTPTDNDYTRIRNAVEAVSDGFTINLQGTFNWAEPNAAVSWAKGNDEVAANGDDYSILVPAGLDSVTFTAPGGLTSATIVGPGDLAAVNLEGVLVFDTNTTNQGWTISNMVIDNFDLIIGMFTSSSAAYTGTSIVGNHFILASDLNSTAAPADVNQNIAIHYSFGKNQTFQGNTIDLRGDSVSDVANNKFASNVGMQSNTGAGDTYDGLLIDGNTVRVVGAQNVANPANIIGIWENGHTHLSDITVSNNVFQQVGGGNVPSANLQRAFRVTSHSSGSTSVVYSNNQIDGANIGFQWLAGQNFAGNQPVQLTGNTLTNVDTGVLVQSNGSATLKGNSFTNTGKTGTGVNVAAGSSASVDGTVSENNVAGFATGILVAGSVTIMGNDASISGNAIGIDVSGTATITGNHIFANNTGVRFVSGGAGSLSSNNFNDSTDNGTDVRLDAGANAVTIGSNNAFAGDTYYIDNRDDQAFNLVGTGSTYEAYSTASLVDNFRIEDLMHHALDDANAGRITVVTANRYVTTPGTGASNETIQRAVNAADANDTVHVENGTHVENVIIDKALLLIGQSQAGTKIVPALSGPNPGPASSLPPGSSNIIRVRADNVEITQLTLDGDNTSLTSGVVRNGKDLDARNGIITDHTVVSKVLNLNVHNVTVNNIYLRGIYASTVGGTFSITNNTLDNVAGEVASIAIFNWGGSGPITGNTISRAADAIATNHSQGAVISSNTVTLSDSGIHSDNNGDSGGVADVISNNTVSNGNAGSYGIFVFAPYLPITVSGNTVTDVNVGLAAFGSDPFAASPPLVTFSNNQVDINGRTASAGVYVLAANVGFGDEDVAVALTGNTIKGAETGVLVRGTTEAANASLINNQIFGNDIGVYFLDGATGSLTTTDFDDAVDNNTDLFVDATAGTVTIGAGSNNQFAGDDYYIDNRDSQAFDLVGTGSTFEHGAGLKYNTGLLADNFDIEDLMFHALDDLASGRITVVAATRYVTTPGTGDSDETIQNAVTAADAGDTVHVELGSFAENVSVPKTLTIVGAGAGTTNVNGAGTGFTVSGAGSITLTGLTVQNPTGFASAGPVTQLKLDNMSVTSTSGGSLANVGTLWVVSSAATGGTYTIGANSFERTTELPISQFTYSAVTKLQVDAGSGVDTFNVEGLGAASATLNAGGGLDAFNLGSNAAGLDDVTGKLTLNGQGAKSSISVNDVNSARTGSTAYTLTGATFLRTAVPTVTFANVNNFALSAESKAGFTNNIVVSQTVAANGMPVSIVGGLLADNFLTSPKAAQVLWSITGTNTGSFIVPATSTVSFSQVQNLNGSAGNDTFTFGAAGQVTSIDAKVGFDVINAGALAATNFAINGLNAGSATGGLGLVSFVGVESLLGSSTGDDTFTFSTTTAAVSGVIDGQGGLADWLDYSGVGSSGITANLLTSSASKTGGITNIENVSGSAGADVLFGNAANNVLLGQGGNDRLSGGAGKDMLIGGNGIDILDGGNDTDVLYGGRANYSQSQLAAYLADFAANGVPALATFPINLEDDAAVDRIYGGAGNDRIYWRSSGSFADLLADFAAGDSSVNV